MFVFRKSWRALFSSKTSFEIRLFALLPANMPRRLVSLEAPTGNKSQEQCNIHV